MADDKLLEEIREQFDYCSKEWADIREEGKKDIRYIADGPWDEDERKRREAAERPCLALDELNQYTNQAINDVRQNKRAVKVIPQGNGANDKTAEYRAGMIRQIEYQSNAQAAYIGGFESMIQRSYGGWKLVAEYDGPKSFDQRLRIVPIKNPDTMYLDPDAKEPDWCDMEYGFLVNSYREKAFKRRWPEAKIQSFSPEHVELAPSWIGDDKVQVAEYWKVEKKIRKLLLIHGPSGPEEVFLDELPGAKLQDSSCVFKLDSGEVAKLPLLKVRKTEDPTVVQYITNGVEILETNPTRWLEVPIIPVFGKELYVDTGSGAKRRLISMVRMARDAYMLYCYYRTCQAELAGMSPKIPYIGYEGQFNTATPWDEVNKGGLAYAEVKATVQGAGNRVLPLPRREVFDPPIGSLEMGAESAKRAIQSAMGITGLLGAHGQNPDAKSGVALKELDSQTSQGNFHFVDNYDRGLERTGRMLEQGLTWCYDTERDVSIRNPDDTHSSIRINGPSQDEKGNPMHFKTDYGDHETTISVGPSQESQRDAANDFVDGLMRMPNAPPKAIALGIRLKNLGPIGDQIAKVFDPEDGAQPLPPQVQQHMAQADQMVQALTETVHKLQNEVDSKAAELASRERIAAMQEETKRTIALATIDSKEGLARLEEELAIIHKKVDHAHDANMLTAEQQHAQELQAREQQHQAEQAQAAQEAAAQQQQAAPPQNEQLPEAA